MAKPKNVWSPMVIEFIRIRAVDYDDKELAAMVRTITGRHVTTNAMRMIRRQHHMDPFKRPGM